MRRRMIEFALLAGLVSIVTAAASAQAQTLKDQLIGTWSVVSAVIEVDGKKGELFGTDPQGQMVFTQGGHYSSHIVRRGRTKFASNSRAAGTPEENKEAVGGYIGEFGTYTVNSGESITLHMISCSFPNWEGTDQERRVHIKDDEMKWETSKPSAGRGHVVITLKRVEKM